MPNCKSFLVTEVERKHVRRRASLVAVACFVPGRAKDLSAPMYSMFEGCLWKLRRSCECRKSREHLNFQSLLVT